MTAPGKGRLSPATTGWVLALLFFGLALFVLVPWKKQPEPEPTPAPYVKPPNKLAAYGLPDNPDFELLPQLFAVHAAQADWQDDKTRFAYWHPGVQRYEYYFEATRNEGKYRFALLPESEFPKEEDLEILDSGWYLDSDESAIFPFRFCRQFPELLAGQAESVRVPRGLTGSNLKVDSQLGSEPLEPIKLPPQKLNLPPTDLEPKK